MSNKFCKAVLLVAFVLAVHASVFAAGRAEREASVGDAVDHHDEDEHIPHIEDVGLKPGERLRVVATTSIIGDVAANVGGDAIALRVLIGVGQDPHGYEPPPSALAAVQDAHLVFVNGLGLEEALLSAVEATARGPIVPVSAGITPIESRDVHHDDGDDHHDDGDDHHDHGPHDPHVWFDPMNVRHWVDNIKHALSAADPDNSELYAARAEDYRGQLDELDAWMRERFTEVPAHRRKLITDHGVLGYLAERYGFEVAGTIVLGTSTSADASARQLADMVRLLRSEEITTIFVGETAGRGLENLARAVAAEMGENVRIVRILTGSLTRPDDGGETYIRYMRYNTERIVAGLAD